MSKIFSALLIGALALITANPVWAANTNAGNQAGMGQQTTGSTQGTPQQLQAQSQIHVQTTGVSPTGVQTQTRTMTQTQTQPVGATGQTVQNQNQVQTQNQAEDQMLSVITQEEEATGMGNGQGTGNKMRSGSVMLVIDSATGAVEKILGVAMVEGSPGQQIQTIAKAQSDAQTAIKGGLGKINARQGVIKSLIGPDYQALKTMTQLKEQNQTRIMELEQLQTQLANQEDITMVQEAIQTLQDQNTALQDAITLEEQSPSLLGWLVKLLVP